MRYIILHGYFSELYLVSLIENTNSNITNIATNKTNNNERLRRTSSNFLGILTAIFENSVERWRYVSYVKKAFPVK